MPKIVLERGHVRLEVMRLIATGEMTNSQIAEKYDVDPSTVTHFAKRNSSSIQAIREKLDDDFAGLWIANKAARIAEYESGYEHLAEIIIDSENDPAIVKAQIGQLFRAQQAALRAVADELGQIPTKTETKVSVDPVTYRLEGVDLNELK